MQYNIQCMAGNTLKNELIFVFIIINPIIIHPFSCLCTFFWNILSLVLPIKNTVTEMGSQLAGTERCIDVFWYIVWHWSVFFTNIMIEEAKSLKNSDLALNICSMFCKRNILFPFIKKWKKIAWSEPEITSCSVLFLSSR